MDKNKILHILVIRLSAMGDVAMTVPVLLAFARAYPEIKITVVTKAFFTPIFSDLPNVAIHIADVKNRHKGILGLWRLFKELSTLRIDAVADLHNVLRSSIVKQFFSFKGVTVKQIDKGRREKKLLVSSKKNHFKPLKTTHERYADVFRALGFRLQLSADNVLPSRKQHIDYKKDKVQIGIAPFAAFVGKQYPLRQMEEVIRRLDGANEYEILLFGGGVKEINILDAIAQKFKSCRVIAGRFPFSEELAIISNLHLMVAMDSGNAHLAAMYGIPTITLWGVTHPYAGFYPFGQDAENSLLSNRDKYPLIPTSIYGNKFPKGYENCMETISPSNVVEKIFNVVHLLKIKD